MASSLQPSSQSSLQSPLRWTLAVAACLGIAVLACGDDKDENNGTNGGGSGAPSGDGEATGVKLSANAAGKPCSDSGDCGGAKCATRLTWGAAGETIEGLLGYPAVGLDTPGGYCTTDCATNADCGEGGVCLGALTVFSLVISRGECRQACTSNSDCREGYECAKAMIPAGEGGIPTGDAGPLDVTALLPNQCQPLPKPNKLGADQTGAACTSDNQATACGAEGLCGIDGSCTGICLKDEDCGSGAVCGRIDLYGSLGLCLETCNVDSDCARDAEGYGCVADANGQKVCTLKQDPLPAGKVGTACADNASCAPGQCARSLGTPAPGGYCSLLNCADDPTLCGPDGACVLGTGLSRCYKACSAASECRGDEGYSCEPRNTSAGMRSVCTPPAPAASDAGVPAAPSDAG